MLSEDTKILEFHQYQEFDNAPIIIYADLECLIEKMDGYRNNPENSSTINVAEHILSGFLMSAISPLKSIGNKHVVYRGKDYMKKFRESLIEHAAEIINFKKEKMKKQTAKIIRTWKGLHDKSLTINMLKIKNIVKLKTIEVHIEIEVRHIVYVI